MKTYSVILAVVVVLMAALLLSAGGCVPKVAGFFGDDQKPVDRATFERQAAERRGKLEVAGARLTAELAGAQDLGDAKRIAEVKADIAAHEAERKTFNQLYGDGTAELNRQYEANEQIFTSLTAAGDYAAAAFGLPPGISQLGIGMLLAFAARAGWVRLKRPHATPPKPRSDPPPAPDPPVSA
jgi:hypothetical protein